MEKSLSCPHRRDRLSLLMVAFNSAGLFLLKLRNVSFGLKKSGLFTLHFAKDCCGKISQFAQLSPACRLICIPGLLSFALCSLPSPVFAGETPKRIVSLAPSMTEVLFALGLEDRVAGVTSFCDYPGAAKKKPKVGGMSNPSLESVIALKPDIVVMTVDGNPKEFEERLRSVKIKTYVFRSTRLAEFPQGIREMGAALGVGERADMLAGEIEKTLVRFRMAGHPAQTKKVLFIVWPEPLIVAGRGSIADDAVTLLKEKNIADDSRTSYPKYSIEEVIRRAPDVIFIGKGKGMEKVSAGLLQRLETVPAVKNGKVFYVSDHLYRLTPRTVQGVEELERYLGKLD